MQIRISDIDYKNSRIIKNIHCLYTSSNKVINITARWYLKAITLIDTGFERCLRIPRTWSSGKMKKKIFEEGRGGKHEGGIGDGHWWWVVGGSGGGADGGSVGVGRARGGKWATEGCTRQVGRGGWTRSPWQPWLGFRAPADGLGNVPRLGMDFSRFATKWG